MLLQKLELWDFRTYRRLETTFGPGPTLVVGENAQGKTNLLEAIYFGAAMRSPRAESESELINRSACAESDMPTARALFTVERHDGPATIDVIVAGRQRMPSDAGAVGGALSVTKRVRINGIPRRASDAAGVLAAVFFSSQDIDLVTGAPALRRKYLDLTMAQLDGRYSRVLAQYNRVLTQRNALLRRVQSGEAREHELTYWDEQLTRLGSYVALSRLRMMTLVSPILRRQYATLSEGREDLALEYLPQLPGILQGDPMSLDVATAAPLFRDALDTARRREIAAGVSLVGPHRDDFAFRLDGAPAASYGSRAQQRMAALALRLAEAQFLREQTREAPVLLLDDILSELDRRRSASVISAIAEYEQSIITSAEPDRFHAAFLAAASVREVKAGQLLPAP
jgi:DNA replication and repair protein RecF